jgi:hypothetical protein
VGGREEPGPRSRQHLVVAGLRQNLLGEILINAGSRRLTLMRLELGSDGGGQAGGPDVDVNGGWSP